MNNLLEDIIQNITISDRTVVFEFKKDTRLPEIGGVIRTVVHKYFSETFIVQYNNYFRKIAIVADDFGCIVIRAMYRSSKYSTKKGLRNSAVIVGFVKIRPTDRTFLKYDITFDMINIKYPREKFVAHRSISEEVAANFCDYAKNQSPHYQITVPV